MADPPLSRKNIDKKLYQAIQEWDYLERKDVEHLFADDIFVLTDSEEIWVIREWRRKKEGDKGITSLRKKEFVEEGGDHRYFYHEVDGKRTSAYTFTSHGSSYKTYDESLLKRMKIQPRLDSMVQVKRLLECPMDEDEYNSILRTKGIF